MPEEAVDVLGDAPQLVSYPAPGVVGVREDRRRRYGQDCRGLVVDVEDGTGSDPAALGEYEMRRYLKAITPLLSSGQPSLGLCILKKKGLRPCIRAKKMPARV